jgi:hypothetical protein
MAPREVENKKRRFELERSKGTRVVRKPYCLDGDIRGALNPCVHRHKIVLALKLKPIAGEINHCDTVRPQATSFIDKIAKRSSQSIIVEVAGAHDVEACRFQRLRDQACVVGSIFQCSGLVGCIAQD